MEYIIIVFLIAYCAIRLIAKGRKPSRSRTHYEEYLEMTKVINSLSDEHDDRSDQVVRSADEHTNREGS